MKHLLTLAMICSSAVAHAQGSNIHQYPWNPDFDGDNFIGISDLTGFLAAFGAAYGSAPAPCDFDGTPLEEWCISIANGQVILDSVFVEYQLQDTFSQFVPGCPDAVTDTLTFSNYSMLYSTDDLSVGQFPTVIFAASNYDAYGELLLIALVYNAENNRFRWQLMSWAIFEEYGYNSQFGDFFALTNSDGEPMPWPSEWSFDENGIHLTWPYDVWPNYANYLHILPYWHYAE